MAAAQILAVGTTAVDSTDVVVASELSVAIKDAAGPKVANGAKVRVQLKDDAGAYFEVDTLSPQRPALILGPGTYRFSRVAGVSCGVFSA